VRWAATLLLALAMLFAASRGYLGVAIDYAKAQVRARATVEQRIAEFGDEAQARLATFFDAADVRYPGQRLALLAFKDSNELQLYALGAEAQWVFVRAYPVLAASGVLGPKLREGDQQVPEGRYRVTFLNANSRFHVSLRLDYPNAFDRAMAGADGRSQLGGDIMIHGNAVSVGCLAMGDEAAEELFTLAAAVGQSQIEVIIAPTDFRRTSAVILPSEPVWIDTLYADLRVALAAFPMPPTKREPLV